MSTHLFLPVKPKWSRLIMSGQKKLELRKRLPSFGRGKRCLIYSSSPKCEVVGTCEYVDNYEFIERDIAKYLSQSCVTLLEFDEYFGRGARFEPSFEWYAIGVACPKMFERPIPLATIRSQWGIEPPQQWRYVDNATFEQIVALGGQRA